MPQQPNLLLDFNPAPQGGQFADILTQPLQQRQDPPGTGWMGPAGDTFMIASKFMEGMQQGKVQKFIRDERKISQEQQALAAYVQEAERTMPESQKAGLRQKYAGVLWQMMQTQSPNQKRTAGNKAKQVETGKAPGILGMVGETLTQILSGMAGGNVPQHTGKVEPIAQFIKETELMKYGLKPGGDPNEPFKMGDPREQTRSGVMQKGFQEATQAIQQIPESERTLDRITNATAAYGTKILAEAPEYYDHFLQMVQSSAIKPGGLSARNYGFLEKHDNPNDRIDVEFDPRTGRMVYPGSTKEIPLEEQQSRTFRKPEYQGPPLLKVEHPDGTVTYETRGNAIGEKAPTPPGNQLRASDLTTATSPDGKKSVSLFFKGGKWFDPATMKETQYPQGYIKHPGGVMPPQTRPPDVSAKLFQLNQHYTDLGDRARKEKENRLEKIEDKMARITFDPANGLTKEQGEHQKALAEARYDAASKFYEARYESARLMLEGMHAKPMDPNITGAVAETHNNPMNLEDRATGQIREFDSVEAGWQAGMAQLRRKMQGHGVLKPKLETLRDVINDWSPKGDGKNDPDAVAAVIAAQMGVKPDVKLSALKGREEELGRFIAKNEPFKGWESLGAKTTLPPKGTPPPASVGRVMSSDDLLKQQ